MSKVKLTDETKSRILNAVRLGLAYDQAAQAARIGRMSFYNWKRKGKEDLEAGRKTEFAQFWTELEAAEADGELALLAKIQKAASDGIWTAAAWILERRYPERYNRSRIEITGANGQPLKTYAVIHPDMWDEVEKLAGEPPPLGRLDNGPKLLTSGKDDDDGDD